MLWKGSSRTNTNPERHSYIHRIEPSTGIPWSNLMLKMFLSECLAISNERQLFCLFAKRLEWFPFDPSIWIGVGTATSERHYVWAGQRVFPVQRSVRSRIPHLCQSQYCLRLHAKSSEVAYRHGSTFHDDPQAGWMLGGPWNSFWFSNWINILSRLTAWTFKPQRSATSRNQDQEIEWPMHCF